jgi:hypothetical protein
MGEIFHLAWNKNIAETLLEQCWNSAGTVLEQCWNSAVQDVHGSAFFFC